MLPCEKYGKEYILIYTILQNQMLCSKLKYPPVNTSKAEAISPLTVNLLIGKYFDVFSVFRSCLMHRSQTFHGFSLSNVTIILIYSW